MKGYAKEKRKSKREIERIYMGQRERELKRRQETGER